MRKHLFVPILLFLLVVCSGNEDLKSSSSSSTLWEALCKLTGSGGNSMKDRSPATPESEKVCDKERAYSYQDNIPDCNCRIGSVDQTVNLFLSPLLTNLTSK